MQGAKGKAHPGANIVAKHYGADIEKPFEDLDEKVQLAMLVGSGDEEDSVIIGYVDEVKARIAELIEAARDDRKRSQS